MTDNRTVLVRLTAQHAHLCELVAELDAANADVDDLERRGQEGTDRWEAAVRRCGQAVLDLRAWVARPQAEAPTPVVNLPPLKPLFERLAAVHPWWGYTAGPSYDGLNEWALDDATLRDVDWMTAHLRLYRALINTVAGLGWSYLYEHPASGTRPGALSPRWYRIQRGTGMDWDDWQPRGGPHRATGPTDVHALLEALVLALEAEVAEGRTVTVDETWRRHDMGRFA